MIVVTSSRESADAASIDSPTIFIPNRVQRKSEKAKKDTSTPMTGAVEVLLDEYEAKKSRPAEKSDIDDESQAPQSDLSTTSIFYTAKFVPPRKNKFLSLFRWKKNKKGYTPSVTTETSFASSLTEADGISQISRSKDSSGATSSKLFQDVASTEESWNQADISRMSSISESYVPASLKGDYSFNDSGRQDSLGHESVHQIRKALKLMDQQLSAASDNGKKVSREKVMSALGIVADSLEDERQRELLERELGPFHRHGRALSPVPDTAEEEETASYGSTIGELSFVEEKPSDDVSQALDALDSLSFNTLSGFVNFCINRGAGNDPATRDALKDFLWTECAIPVDNQLEEGSIALYSNATTEASAKLSAESRQGGMSIPKSLVLPMGDARDSPMDLSSSLDASMRERFGSMTGKKWTMYASDEGNGSLITVSTNDAPRSSNSYHTRSQSRSYENKKTADFSETADQPVVILKPKKLVRDEYKRGSILDGANSKSPRRSSAIRKGLNSIKTSLSPKKSMSFRQIRHVDISGNKATSHRQGSYTPPRFSTSRHLSFEDTSNFGADLDDMKEFPLQAEPMSTFSEDVKVRDFSQRDENARPDDFHSPPRRNGTRKGVSGPPALIITDDVSPGRVSSPKKFFNPKALSFRRSPQSDKGNGRPGFSPVRFSPRKALQKEKHSVAISWDDPVLNRRVYDNDEEMSI